MCSFLSPRPTAASSDSLQWHSRFTAGPCCQIGVAPAKCNRLLWARLHSAIVGHGTNNTVFRLVLALPTFFLSLRLPCCFVSFTRIYFIEAKTFASHFLLKRQVSSSSSPPVYSGLEQFTDISIVGLPGALSFFLPFFFLPDFGDFESSCSAFLRAFGDLALSSDGLP